MERETGVNNNEKVSQEEKDATIQAMELMRQEVETYQTEHQNTIICTHILDILIREMRKYDEVKIVIPISKNDDCYIKLSLKPEEFEMIYRKENSSRVMNIFDIQEVYEMQKEKIQKQFQLIQKIKQKEMDMLKMMKQYDLE